MALPGDAAADPDGFVETGVYALGGSFLFLLDIPGARRLYLDADGSLSAVFEPATGRAASTAGVLLSAQAYAARFRRKLYAHLNVLRDGWFPAGLTAHEGVTRLLVNHCLDFDRMTQARHWPKAQIPITGDPQAACARIMASTRATIDALRRTGPARMTLTAGNETRMLLAACRDIATELEFVTVSGPSTRLDCDRARELAARFGLKLRLLPIRHADAAGAAEWHARAGHCIGGPNMVTHPTIAPLAGPGWFIGGLGGEIGRGFFWRPTDTGDTEITAQSIQSRFGMPPHPEVEAAVAAWRPSIDGFDPFLQLDLAYLELRMGCWAFAQSYASPEVRHMHPMISRESFAAMLSLPPDWRRSHRMVRASIEAAWPELLELPINRYGDWRDALRLLARAAAEPHLVLKKLRKRFG
ncbi:MAG: hypothetical protein D6754_00330 [Alphaproteobacteria bacterium]|nr:MAG: hypothetical protein D6754_00330 [Alphaproteobacteria bacterium]